MAQAPETDKPGMDEGLPPDEAELSPEDASLVGGKRWGTIFGGPTADREYTLDNLALLRQRELRKRQKGEVDEPVVDEETIRSDPSRWGTIFMGPNTERETTIDKVTLDKQREIWNRRTEAEYMERVRAKATLRVQTMLDQARSRAEVIRGTARQWAEKVKAECEEQYAQAERIRQEAEQFRQEAVELRESFRLQGHEEGLDLARQELEEHRMALNDATGSVLKTIQEQYAAFYETWRTELVDLVRDAVAVLSSQVLSEERSAIIAKVLDEAVNQLDERQRLVVRANPEDADAVSLVIDSAKSRFPDVEKWEVKVDPGIESGGLVLETGSGMVDNRMEVRRQAVKEILDHLSLPPGPAEAAGDAAVNAAMEASGLLELAALAEQHANQMAAAMNAPAPLDPDLAAEDLSDVPVDPGQAPAPTAQEPAPAPAAPTSQQAPVVPTPAMPAPAQAPAAQAAPVMPAQPSASSPAPAAPRPVPPMPAQAPAASRPAPAKAAVVPQSALGGDPELRLSDQNFNELEGIIGPSEADLAANPAQAKRG